MNNADVLSGIQASLHEQLPRRIPIKIDSSVIIHVPVQIDSAITIAVLPDKR